MTSQRISDMSSDDVRAVNETQHQRFLEGVGQNTMSDGPYMDDDGDESPGEGEELEQFDDENNSQKDQITSNDQVTSNDQAESVKDYNTDNAAYNNTDETAVDGEAPQKLESPVPLGRIRTRLFSSKLQSQRQIYQKKFIFNLLMLGALSIAMFSLYWGALYNHKSHFHQLKFIAFLGDDGELTESIEPILRNAVPNFVIYNDTTFKQKYGENVNVTEKIHHLVHTLHYWGSLIVYPNATNAFVDSLTNSDSSAFNSTDYFEFFYESARDLTNYRTTILPLLTQQETTYKETYFYKTYFPKVISNLSNIPASKLSAASDMQWREIDNRPFTDSTLMGPMQVGLIYCVLLTFFQLALFGPVHGMITPLLKPVHIIVYRLVSSWATYFFLSLFFCTVSAIFKVDFTLAYGRAGFVVYWMTTWLVMGAVGGANENVLSLLLAFYPQFLGFWLISWIILNISPSFVSMILCNRLYRYGYMTPIYNGLECYRVIFMNTYKGNLGRNYGVLVAWCVLNTLLFPLVMRIVGRKFMNDAKKKATESK